jgi:hypothetical protein
MTAFRGISSLQPALLLNLSFGQGSEGTGSTVTEAEWLSGAEPESMLDSLAGKVSARKLRLFACACCRQVWRLLTDERSRRAVDLAERYADGVADEDERFNAWEAACEAGMAGEADAGNAAEAASRSSDESDFALDAALEAANAEAHGNYLAARDAALAGRSKDQEGFYSDQDCDRAADAGIAAKQAAMSAEAARQCNLLRDIFGNPFRPVALSRAWLPPAVLALAQAAYESRASPPGTLDRERLAILADALEENGCSDGELLGHLRGPGPHVRGCWAVDLVLAKE